MPHEPNKCPCIDRTLFRLQFFIGHIVIYFFLFAITSAVQGTIDAGGGGGGGGGGSGDDGHHRHHHPHHPRPSVVPDASDVKCPQPSDVLSMWMDSGSKAYISPIVFTGKLISLSEDYSGRLAASFRVLKTIKNIGSSHGQVPVNPLPGSIVVLYFVTKKDPSWLPVPPHCAVHLKESQVAELRPVGKYIVYASSPLTSLVNLHKNQMHYHSPSFTSTTSTTFTSSSTSTSTFSTNYSTPSSSTSTSVSSSELSSNNSSNKSHTSQHTYISYLTAFAPPDLLSKRATRSMRRVLCPQCASAPEVTGLNGDLRVESHGNLRLRCKVTGNPSPLIQWYRNGKPLANKGRVSIQYKRRSSILQIRKVHASMDTGYYECHAINPVSMSIGRVRVIVTRLVKPSPVGSAPPSKDLPTEGTGTTTTATTAIPFSGPTAESREKLPWAPSDWQVRSCPIADYCLNGGQCSFYESVGEYVCQCADGYKGMRCEMKDLYGS